MVMIPRTMHHNEWIIFLMGLWLLITTVENMILYTTFGTGSYFTHHSDMDSPHYVHIDVPSDSLCHWALYYTYHSHMEATQYEHVDEQSE